MKILNYILGVVFLVATSLNAAQQSHKNIAALRAAKAAAAAGKSPAAASAPAPRAVTPPPAPRAVSRDYEAMRAQAEAIQEIREQLTRLQDENNQLRRLSGFEGATRAATASRPEELLAQIRALRGDNDRLRTALTEQSASRAISAAGAANLGGFGGDLRRSDAPSRRGAAALAGGASLALGGVALAAFAGRSAAPTVDPRAPQLLAAANDRVERLQGQLAEAQARQAVVPGDVVDPRIEQHQSEIQRLQGVIAHLQAQGVARPAAPAVDPDLAALQAELARLRAAATARAASGGGAAAGVAVAADGDLRDAVIAQERIAQMTREIARLKRLAGIQEGQTAEEAYNDLSDSQKACLKNIIDIVIEEYDRISEQQAISLVAKQQVLSDAQVIDYFIRISQEVMKPAWSAQAVVGKTFRDREPRNFGIIQDVFLRLKDGRDEKLIAQNLLGVELGKGLIFIDLIGKLKDRIVIIATGTFAQIQNMMNDAHAEITNEVVAARIQQISERAETNLRGRPRSYEDFEMWLTYLFNKNEKNAVSSASRGLSESGKNELRRAAHARLSEQLRSKPEFELVQRGLLERTANLPVNKEAFNTAWDSLKAFGTEATDRPVTAPVRDFVAVARRPQPANIREEADRYLENVVLKLLNSEQALDFRDTLATGAAEGRAIDWLILEPTLDWLTGVEGTLPGGPEWLNQDDVLYFIFGKDPRGLTGLAVNWNAVNKATRPWRPRTAKIDNRNKKRLLYIAINPEKLRNMGLEEDARIDSVIAALRKQNRPAQAAAEREARVQQTAAREAEQVAARAAEARIAQGRAPVVAPHPVAAVEPVAAVQPLVRSQVAVPNDVRAALGGMLGQLAQRQAAAAGADQARAGLAARPPLMPPVAPAVDSPDGNVRPARRPVGAVDMAGLLGAINRRRLD